MKHEDRTYFASTRKDEVIVFVSALTSLGISTNHSNFSKTWIRAYPKFGESFLPSIWLQINSFTLFKITKATQIVQWSTR